MPRGNVGLDSRGRAIVYPTAVPPRMSPTPVPTGEIAQPYPYGMSPTFGRAGGYLQGQVVDDEMLEPIAQPMPVAQPAPKKSTLPTPGGSLDPSNIRGGASSTARGSTSNVDERMTVTPDGMFNEGGENITAAQNFNPRQTAALLAHLQGTQATGASDLYDYEPSGTQTEIVPGIPSGMDDGAWAPGAELDNLVRIAGNKATNERVAEHNQDSIAQSHAESAMGAAAREADAQYQALAAERAQKQADAEAAIGFTEETGLPWSKDLGPMYLQARKEQRIDLEFAQDKVALKKAFEDGKLSKEAFEEESRKLALNWTVRRNAPPGAFKAYAPQSVTDSLLSGINEPAVPAESR